MFDYVLTTINVRRICKYKNPFLISDYKYDCLVEELEQLEKKYPESNISLYRKN